MGTFIKRFLAIFGITIGMILVALLCAMWICTHGPSSRAKELFVLSVRETSAIGFLADWFCTPEEIASIEAANKIEEDIVVDTSKITIASNSGNSGNTGVTGENGMEGVGELSGAKDAPQGNSQEVGADAAIPEEDIEFHNISAGTYRGIMMVVKDPSRVFVGTSSPQYVNGVPGKKVVDMIASYGAVAGVNAGGFEDPQGAGDGGIPKGVVISEGTLRYGSAAGRYEIIGMNNNNVLIVGTMTAQQALDSGVRDAVSFGPVLVANGEATKASQGGGLNPRTAIGQRADGAILLLVIDGRQSSSLGASYSDVTDVMLEYGAVNAANLDGGSSSVMYYEGELLNSCSSLYGPREMPTCIVVR